MRVKCTTLWLPKKGNTIEEYEDAAAPLDPVDSDATSFRCAVADGATETSFSALWAKLLVNGFVDGTARDQLKSTWQDSLVNKTLAWYAEEKAQSGAFAALVGLTITDAGNGGGTWECEAVGDSCLVIVRGTEFIEKFPLTESEQFNSSPVLLSSMPESAQAPGEQMEKKSGEWQRGDIFYLLTDAIARWTYKRQEEHGDAAGFLKGIKTHDEMVAFVDLQRSLTDEENRPLMRNDDVTLLRVEIQ